MVCDRIIGPFLAQTRPLRDEYAWQGAVSFHSEYMTLDLGSHSSHSPLAQQGTDQDTPLSSSSSPPSPGSSGTQRSFVSLCPSHEVNYAVGQVCSGGSGGGSSGGVSVAAASSSSPASSSSSSTSSSPPPTSSAAAAPSSPDGTLNGHADGSGGSDDISATFLNSPEPGCRTDPYSSDVRAAWLDQRLDTNTHPSPDSPKGKASGETDRETVKETARETVREAVRETTQETPGVKGGNRYCAAGTVNRRRMRWTKEALEAFDDACLATGGKVEFVIQEGALFGVFRLGGLLMPWDGDLDVVVYVRDATTSEEAAQQFASVMRGALHRHGLTMDSIYTISQSELHEELINADPLVFPIIGLDTFPVLPGHGMSLHDRYTRVGGAGPPARARVFGREYFVTERPTRHLLEKYGRDYLLAPHMFDCGWKTCV